MKQKLSQYHVYMLRIWTQGQEQAQAIRLSIEDPRTGQRVGFGTLHELLAFLQQSHAPNATD